VFLTEEHGLLYYFVRMSARGAQLGSPPPVRPTLPPMEEWYLASLRIFVERRGRPPWLHELAAWLDKSRTAVFSALVSLEGKGYVRRAGASRSKADRRFVPVPVQELQ